MFRSAVLFNEMDAWDTWDKVWDIRLKPREKLVKPRAKRLPQIGQFDNAEDDAPKTTDMVKSMASGDQPSLWDQGYCFGWGHGKLI